MARNRWIEEYARSLKNKSGRFYSVAWVHTVSKRVVVGLNSRVRASPPSASWDRSRGQACGCGISPAATRIVWVSRRWERSVYGPRASPRPLDVVAGPKVSAALALVLEPQPRPRDAVVELDEVAPPRLRLPRPHLRSPIAPPVEDRRRPHHVAAAARESVARTTDNRRAYVFLHGLRGFLCVTFFGVFIFLFCFCWGFTIVWMKLELSRWMMGLIVRARHSWSVILAVAYTVSSISHNWSHNIP